VLQLLKNVGFMSYEVPREGVPSDLDVAERATLVIKDPKDRFDIRPWGAQGHSKARSGAPEYFSHMMLECEWMSR
jgi:hypothetical protein